MKTQISLQSEVPEALAGKRLDQIAAQLFPDFSRARLQTWIREGSLRVNEQERKPRDKLLTGDLLAIEAELVAEDEWTAEALPLDIVFEDEELLVINKAAGLVVHPAAGHRDGTLLNGLLHHCPQLEEIPRAGIVHRLDKDTTGLMVVAKTLQSHLALVKLLQTRDVTREYEAVVQGVLTGGGTVDEPLERHPVHRQKRAVVRNGKEAITHYRVIQRYRCHTHIQVNLETGRTHQIRVHMAHLKHPLVGDPLYGGRLQIPLASTEELQHTLQQFRRQALHARHLQLLHPVRNEVLGWDAPRPPDMDNLLRVLAEDQSLVAAG